MTAPNLAQIERVASIDRLVWETHRLVVQQGQLLAKQQAAPSPETLSLPGFRWDQLLFISAGVSLALAALSLMATVMHL